ncbi:MAG: glycosyltransferase family 2 protein [Flavobacteriales bacterium]|jgi:glycosyltransferase involved in cell wall biosynthesis|nr:glycosyltransferase family 2 protein [Flavobacteriales bacterium]MBK8707750.1 glycosyltransferase family 2 protein [Flavobacteriales bacterium]
MMPKLSLAICTHNPRTDYLDRTLRSLQKQTIPLDQWELLLIDNASTNGVVQTMDLAWHPNAHVVKEARIGLTMARLRAIEETSTPYLVFADDDNELAPDYLATMIRLAQLHPTLGVIGAGRIVPDFEETPAPELKPYVPMVTLREVQTDQWSNDPMDEAIPWGCGMMVRREVATQYHSSLSKDPSKQGLDRTGDSLNSCGDEQFSLVACEMGLGKGIFVDLDLVHLIGKQRVQKEYLLRLAEAHAFSKAMLMHIHGGKVPVQRSPPTWSKFFGHVLRLQLGMVFLEGTRLWDRRSREHVAREFDDARRTGIARFHRTVHG